MLDDELTKKIPIAKNRYPFSLKDAKSTQGPDFLGGILGLKSKFAKINVTSCTKPIALTVHAIPILPRSCLAIEGNINPPVALPVAVIPKARARRLLKYVETTARLGVNMRPLPSPVHRPCARRSCQKVVLSEVMKTPRRVRNVPAAKVARKYPASVKRPAKVPMKNRAEIWTEPIQEIWLAGLGRWVV